MTAVGGEGNRQTGNRRWRSCHLSVGGALGLPAPMQGIQAVARLGSREGQSGTRGWPGILVVAANFLVIP